LQPEQIIPGVIIMLLFLMDLILNLLIKTREGRPIKVDNTS
jgi:hypothetical protein